jgi:2-oxoisovalerate dehydrogenase E1 component alpha subunit
MELVTYRRDAHSTSDDPSQYRAADEADHWPGGDPVERLKRHLIQIGEWSDGAHRQLDRALDEDVAATFRQAEVLGAAANHDDLPLEMLFEDVYAAPPAHLREQLEEAKSESGQIKHEGTILPFTSSDRRAVG